MKRTIETSPIRSLLATGETWGLYLASEMAGNSVNLPRTSLAIVNAMNIAFPDELAGRKSEALQVISSVAPVLIAANEAADIGISARLQIDDASEKLTEEKKEGLRRLEAGTYAWLGRSVAGFKDVYGPDSRQSQMVDALIRDFLTLSEGRRSFSESEYREYVELDSVIYVLGCIALAAPGVSETYGFEMRERCAGIEDVRRKYSAFVVGRDVNGRRKVLLESGDQTAALTMARVMSLQGAEMVLKVMDDKEGRKIDKLLGIPSLYGYAESKTGDDQSLNRMLDEMRSEYFFLAETGGLSSFAVRSAELLSHVTGVGKTLLACLRSGNGVMENASIADSTTTTLRHELDAAGVLESLFSV